MRNPETDEFKDIIQSYYKDQKKKFDIVTLSVMWKKNGLPINKIFVRSVIKIRKPYLFEPNMIELPFLLEVSAYDYIDQFNKECVNDEIDIIFISVLKDFTFFHYMNQPRSML